MHIELDNIFCCISDVLSFGLCPPKARTLFPKINAGSKIKARASIRVLLLLLFLKQASMKKKVSMMENIVMLQWSNGTDFRVC